MSTDYCATHGDEPQAVDLCSCKQAMDRFVENSEHTDEVNAQKTEWTTNFNSKFKPDWISERDRLKALTPWGESGWNVKSYAWFNQGANGNKNSTFGKPLFSGKDKNVNMGGLDNNGGYVCHDAFHDKGSDGDACHFYYPHLCNSPTACKKVQTTVRDADIKWVEGGMWDSNETGDCDGLCLSQNCDRLFYCKLSDGEINNRLSSWIPGYERQHSDKAPYTCDIPYPQSPDQFMEQCPKYQAIIPAQTWPQDNIQCCANILNVENSEANLDHIQQNCSNKLTQQISQIAASPPPSSSTTPSPSPAPAPTPSGEGDDSDNTLYIVGGIIGLLIFLIIIGVIIFAVVS